MITFSNVQESFNEELLKRKLEKNSRLFIKITCDFCDFQQDHECKGSPNFEKAVQDFYDSGWQELVTKDKTGIACPICMDRWENGSDPNSYDEEWAKNHK
jgi:hypothetical protein